MGAVLLSLHVAERVDGLAEMLAGVLEEPLSDPMAAEIVSVPTRGIERWLAQFLSCRLGGRDGICANVEFPFPSTVISAVLAEAAEEDPRNSPWAPDRLVWPLLEVIEENLAAPWLAPLSRPAGSADPPRPRRLYSTARRIADLFDRYGVHRPELIAAWAAGDDSGVPEGQAWQAELWRRLRRHLGRPSPAEMLGEHCRQIRAGKVPLQLPERLSLFGLTRLPASYLQVLSALSEVAELRLFLLHPSAGLWEKLASAELGQALPRKADRSGDLVANPLLASWGRDAREMQLVLAASGAPVPTARWHSEPHGSHRPGSTPPSPTLLERIQADIRADLAPPGPPLPGRPDARMLLERSDQSIQFHLCHGRSRQVEVARDAILHLLRIHADLEPRDVLIMCPDVETFAPLVEATFGAGAVPDPQSSPPAAPGDGSALPALPLRVADRSLRQANPLSDIACLLLELAASRVSASEVLDLASRPAVRRRFGLGDEELRRMASWIGSAGIRWGLDATHRQSFGLGDIAANTWRAGLDRIVAGAAMAEGEGGLFSETLPLDDVASSDLSLVGRLAELMERLQRGLDSLREPKAIGDWMAALAQVLDSLCDSAGEEAWQRAQLGRILSEIAANATDASGRSCQIPMERVDVLDLLDARLAGRPSRVQFRTGEATLCTLVPMRAVPHRVVCLLGMDDGAFPRNLARDGDDVLAANPKVGERDPRSEDRQLLLDALGAATEHLVVLYSGRDERTNIERPPAVPIGELLEVIDRTARCEDGRSASQAVMFRHPLQPFDPANFISGAIVAETPWSFDPLGRSAAEALRAQRKAAEPFLAKPLAPLEKATIEISELAAFLRHPVKAFLRARLGFVPDDSVDKVDDRLPVSLDSLALWRIGDRLLAKCQRGSDLEEEITAELARGTLPPGRLGDAPIEELRRSTEAILEALGGLGAPGAAQPTSVPIDLELPSGQRLVGNVANLYGDTLRYASFSRLGPGHHISAWLDLLALAANIAGRPLEAVTAARADPKLEEGGYLASVSQLSWRGADLETAELALAELQSLVDLYQVGMCEPLPLYPRTTFAWAKAARSHDDCVRAARGEWESGYRAPKEDADPSHVTVLGGVVAFEEILSDPPGPGEDGPGWDLSESTRFGRYVLRLWGRLLDHERTRHHR